MLELHKCNLCGKDCGGCLKRAYQCHWLINHAHTDTLDEKAKALKKLLKFADHLPGCYQMSAMGRASLEHKTPECTCGYEAARLAYES